MRYNRHETADASAARATSKSGANKRMFFFSDGEDHNLIVLDLEWNQSSYAPNLLIPHEIIEIGACRVDASFQVTDTFSRLIRPKVYRKLDRRIGTVTGITNQELSQGGTFKDVFEDFIAWCGEDTRIVTWGRDDYPVLRRNTAFFQCQLPISPPIDAQLVFGHAVLGKPHQQMNLHHALDHMNLSPGVPAHRAIYDAQCTAALLPAIEEAVCAMTPNAYAQLQAMMDKESRIASSSLCSVTTQYFSQADALADRTLMTVYCPTCGELTGYEVPWFESGKEHYTALVRCPAHGLIVSQMHFKRGASKQLIMHRRAYVASQEDATEVREGYRLYLQTPPKLRRHQKGTSDAHPRKEQPGSPDDGSTVA